nr:hypothetical protein [Tanacetum cinerariifolium]
MIHVLRVGLVINSPGNVAGSSSDMQMLVCADFSNILVKTQSSRYVVLAGRLVVPTGRYVVPAGNVIVVSAGRLSVIPTGRVLVPTGRVLSPGRNRIVVPG